MAENTRSSSFDLSLAVEPELMPEIVESPCFYSTLFGRLSESPPHTFADFQIDRLIDRPTHIHSLPIETLCAIFDEGRREITPREGSWITSVSRVCRRWRDIAVHSPFLWTKIYYGPRFLSASYTQTCLDRSKNCPLDIVLDFCDTDRHFQARLINHIDQIVLHSCRWRHLYVHFHRSKSLLILLSRLPRKAPILQDIRITLTSQDGRQQSFSMFDLGAPMLSSIELRGISLASIALPAERLTSLELTHSRRPLNPDEFKRALTASSSLKELSLSGDVVSFGVAPWSLIHIPTLLSLKLSPGPEASFRHLCTMLILPSLEYLTLQHIEVESVRIFVDSFHIHTSKFPPLQSLELCTVSSLDISAVEIIDLFEKLDMITQLSLISIHSSTYTSLKVLEIAPQEELGPPTNAFLGRNPDVEHTKSLDSFYGFESESVCHLEHPDSPEFKSSIPVKRVLLPKLCTIGIVPIGGINIAQLCDLLSSRAAAKRPISCFKTYGYDQIPPCRLQWLKENVRLEEI